MTDSIDCLVFRCAKQQDMYLYLRSDLEAADVPEVLRKKMGMLTQVMELSLTPRRKLARVDVERVMAALAEQGYYLQMPPRGQLQAHLYAGD